MQNIDDNDLREAIQFHGHLCPGLALGYRVAKAALRELKAERPRDEELVAIVENDSCAADAIQFITGATFGKGNLIFRDYVLLYAIDKIHALIPVSWILSTGEKYHVHYYPWIFSVILGFRNYFLFYILYNVQA